MFISPEKLVSDSFLKHATTFPRVSLVCVDEVHCMSEWSHNFRPAYLRMKGILQRLNIKRYSKLILYIEKYNMLQIQPEPQPLIKALYLCCKFWHSHSSREISYVREEILVRSCITGKQCRHRCTQDAVSFYSFTYEISLASGPLAKICNTQIKLRLSD